MSASGGHGRDWVGEALVMAMWAVMGLLVVDVAAEAFGASGAMAKSAGAAAGALLCWRLSAGRTKA